MNSLVLEEKNIQIQVDFIEAIDAPHLVETIGLLNQPQVLLWYIGPYGLKRSTVDFYKKNFISPLIKHASCPTFWLIDLMAWGALKNYLTPLNKSSKCSDLIDNFQHNQIKMLRSSLIFEKMYELFELPTLGYFTQVLKNPFIWRKSAHYKPTGIPLNKLITKSHLSEELGSIDAAHGYSALQYLEGCLFVCEIIKNRLLCSNEPIEIVFALPNDEYEYYLDEKSSFKKDLSFLINYLFPEIHQKISQVNIHFYSFKYGKSNKDRPYIALDESKMKKHDLSIEKICG
jgi:hypothetical protein